ncbi:GrpB family protein [Bacillus daqingensis]|uniref:GrpB family protein n=1 Tax=Bacillus daqingensis TaxID=872396 RepID=A0ABV9P1H8_9BACI
MLGLKRNDVRLVPYDPQWSQMADERIKELSAVTDIPENRIAHIGSTAIADMPAKPIIDLAIGVDQLDADHNDLFCRLKQCGFLRLRVQKQEEIVFAAFTDDSYETKTHILHLMTYNGELWNNLLFFRNYMNTHSAEHSAYAALKKRAAAAHPTSIPAYTEEKTAFVHRIYQLRT